MSKDLNSKSGSSSRKPSQSNAPHEKALNSAFDKLTSEVLIFLLAYMILLIGLAVFGSKIATDLQSLLYLIPILGVVAYIWLKKQSIIDKERSLRIEVYSQIAEDKAYVGGCVDRSSRSQRM